MENTSEIRKRIHNFIDIADERILNLFTGIIEAEEQADNYPEVLSYIYDQIAEERRKYLNGETDSHSWEEMKERLMQKFTQ